MFELDRFIADCRAAVAEDPSHKLVRAVVERAVADPASVLKGVGEPKLGRGPADECRRARCARAAA